MRGWGGVEGPERVKCSWWVPVGRGHEEGPWEVRVGEWGETTLIVYLGSGGIVIFNQTNSKIFTRYCVII